MHFIGPKNQIVVVFSIIPLEEKKSIEKNKSDNKMHFAREHSQLMFCYTFYLLIIFFDIHVYMHVILCWLS